MRIDANTSLREVAFIVCTRTTEAGYVVVLSGGSAATVYAPMRYQSRDLDFVIELASGESGSAGALESLGYRIENSMYFHESNPLTIDFIKGPIMIGDDEVSEWSTLTEGKLKLNILTPTDCVRDRLAGFLFWHDRSSLQQAIWVAQAQSDAVDLAAIGAWCAREGETEKYKEFARLLNAAP